jgi:hypothetical protein
MRDQQNAGPVMYVAVIVDIDQEVTGDALLLDPAVKNGNQFLEINGQRIGGEKLHPNSMKFHYCDPTAFSV